ncbi:MULTISPECIES: c-type cytochrome [Marinobacter]|uniref:Cytochrome c n=1 Tax=Marinobacter suaedae TaxID=3057675 RepID=A0ABT8VY17_9GAMM|nr:MULTISPECIES: cytochrome c [unclassified Marinobacter]MBZ2168994.1 cytochrome c [Marinobacter sp. F4216]MDO3720877.1 cytochrome c [Marinobacter sp. chi1]
MSKAFRTALERALVPALLLSAVSLPVYSADPEAGRKLAAQCKTCHGLDGIATIPIAPNLAGESQIYIQNQLKAFRSGKREHEMMTVVARDLTDQQIADVAAWYESIEVTAKLPE